MKIVSEYLVQDKLMNIKKVILTDTGMYLVKHRTDNTYKEISKELFESTKLK